MTAESTYDALIIGGSTAGLSAALTLGRSLRRVLVLDGGQPCNWQTPHSHNFFTRDGATPQHLLALGCEQLRAYPTVSVLQATVVRAASTPAGFHVTTTDGQTFTGRKVLLATGVKDQLLPLPGFAECWGISVLHCPYCHGYEVHGQPLGVLGNGDQGFEFARLIQHWSADLRLFTNGSATLTAEQMGQLTARGIRIVEAPIAAVEHTAGQLHHLRLADGQQEPLTALFAHVPATQSTDLAQQLGCALTAQQLIQVDDFGATTAPGVFAAGDNSSPMRQLSIASARGGMAGAFLNRELVLEDF